MTYEEVDRLARLLIDADHYCSVEIYRVMYYHQAGTANWCLRVREAGSPDKITLPDAASCAAYRDARRGSVPQSGAPDFGAGGL